MIHFVLFVLLTIHPSCFHFCCCVHEFLMGHSAAARCLLLDCFVITHTLDGGFTKTLCSILAIAIELSFKV